MHHLEVIPRRTIHQLGRLLPRERMIAATILVAIALVRIAYLIANCPLELAADEAHYWDWSRHLDWSYYSKGPLVAWLIRLSCELFGPLSERLIGSPMLAIRLPALLCQIGMFAAVYVLTIRITRSEAKALACVAVGLTLPIIAAGGTLMTIDGPYTCCWAWALVFGHAAILRGRKWAWPILGLTVGLGILAKYTMVIWLPCCAMFMLTSRPYRHLLARSGFWIACGIAALCCLPILVWNAQNDWITLRHVGTQAAGEADQWRLLGPLRFIAEQAGVLLVYWFVGYIGAAWDYAPGRARDPGRCYLWWASIPVFAIFLLASLRSPGQLNWPVAAYIGGIVLAVDWVVEQRRRMNSNYRVLIHAGLALATIAGLTITMFMHYPQIMRPMMIAAAGPPSKLNPMPLRKYDPTARLRGWRHLASVVDALRCELRQSGDEPIIATSFWSLPAELAVYCDGHPEVYCLGTALQQRMSQYDLWRPNPIWDPEAFVGRTIIYVGDMSQEVIEAFAHMEQTRRIEYSEGGFPLVYWNVTVGRGFRGFGPPDKWPGQRRY